MTEPTASRAELARWRETALSICDEADKMALAGFRRGVRVSTKPDRSLVTAVDRQIEALARDRLRVACPGAGIVGEEEGAGRRLACGERPSAGPIDLLDSTESASSQRRRPKWVTNP
jgi:fructose-1,6-bisphosphatase/inositol monophosphatase family enzyme